MNRPDDYKAMQALEGKYMDGVALVVLGGPSGKNWQQLKEEVKPDVILTANGAAQIGADYWLLAENMHYQHLEATRMKSERAKGFMDMINAPNDAKTRLISHRTWDLIKDRRNCIRIRRVGWEKLSDPSLREYGDGFLYGPLFKRPDCVQPKINFHVGTVGTHLLHLAGILGCREVHTIGFDLCFREGDHHWYKHPKYEPDRFRTAQMFTTFVPDNGGPPLDTAHDMIDAAVFLNSIEWLFIRDELEWTDHSDGLLKGMGLWCAE